MIKFVKIPKVIESYPNLLVQEYVPSASLAEAKNWDHSTRSNLAHHLVAVFLHMIFRSGRFQADMNPGNLGFLRNGTVVLYDFGTVISIPTPCQDMLKTWCTSAHPPPDVLAGFTALGFDQAKLKNISNLNLLASAIFAPLASKEPWSAKNWDLKHAMAGLTDTDLWWFRSSGPPWFLYLMRSFFGVLHALRMLDTTIDFNRCFALANISREGVIPMQFHIPELPKTSLRVLVTEHGDDIVSITMPVRAIENLEILIPETALHAITEAGINIEQIKDKAITSGLTPQDLFTANSGNRHYRVWIADGF